jgi:hypothetical protein
MESSAPPVPASAWTESPAFRVLVKVSTEPKPSLLLQNGDTPWLPGFFEKSQSYVTLEHWHSALAKVRDENVD